MSDEKRNYEKKPLEEMNVIDDFLFTEMVTDEVRGPEVCRIILSRVLKKEVGEISYEVQKVVPGASEKSHGIRLDVYVRETKADKNVGVRYMKSWEWEREIRKEEQEKTEAERKRADEAEKRADAAEAELAKYKAKFGEIA